MKNRQWKESNLDAAFDVLDILIAHGYHIELFNNEYHWKINGVLDVWPTTRTWYYKKTGERGRYDELVRFVRGLFESYPQKTPISGKK